jgi:single-strand DNA-binding protein
MAGGLAPPEYVQGAIMNNLNSILIEGNLVRDPLLRSTPKGTPVCTFSLASNRVYRQDNGFEKEVSFFEIETWSRLAEACHDKGHKGRGVRVVGRLKQNRWTDTEGKKHSSVTIVAEHVEFRPVFKKDGDKTVSGAEAAADAGTPVYAETEPDGMDIPVRERELEAVTF